MTFSQLSLLAVKQLAANHVLYVDRGIVVLNKPAGLVCQKQASPEAFDRHLKKIQRILDQEEPLYPLHRLDKGTTGALVLARTLPLARELSRQLQGKVLRKSYLALVDTTKAVAFNKHGILRMPLLNEDGRISISPKGKDAITEYELFAEAPNAPVSLLRLNLVTGLKHQLRIHLAQGLQAPIRGDSFYARGNTRSHANAKHPDHMYLHASEVTMTRYRKEGASKKFALKICAPLPPRFVAECEVLGIDRSLPLAQTQACIFVDDNQTIDGFVPELEGTLIAAENKT